MKAPPPRKNTGGTFERLVVKSAESFAPLGLHLRKNDPRFAGQHLAGGGAVGHITGKGGLDFEGRLDVRWCGLEAKSTENQTAFPLSMLREHQVGIIEAAATDGAIAFLLIEFSALKGGPRYFALDWSALEPWWVAYAAGKGRASIPFKAIVEQAVEVRRAGKLLDVFAAVRAMAGRVPA
ncbi:MAG: Holliday junction resolvase RecU [Elusimicrobia bacterium]|nr:Holliday junction resolvase RecU [Elusimicrobiota bacterium]